MTSQNAKSANSLKIPNPIRRGVTSLALESGMFLLSGCGNGLFGEGFDRSGYAQASESAPYRQQEVSSNQTTDPKPVAPRVEAQSVTPQSYGSCAFHTVESGDTVFAISRKTGTPVKTIIEANNLAAPYTLKVNQRISLPSSTRTHTVRSGDTAYSLARRYNVPLRDLAAHNALGSSYALKPGQSLSIPCAGGGDSTAIAFASSNTGDSTRAASNAEGTTSQQTMSSTTGESSSPAQTIATAPADNTPIGAPPSRSGTFGWPIQGKVLASFGQLGTSMRNDGINISAKHGAIVKASENGVVVYVGNEIRGFGNLILIKHQNNYMTAYAHLDGYLVNRGDKVTKGQNIARVGSTGSVTSPQLHFEIRKNSKPIDPMPYLKGSKAVAAR